MDNRDYWKAFGNILPSETKFDKSNMLLTMELYNKKEDVSEEYVFNAVYKVCPCCDGKGTHVNPNIDRNGLTYEDFNNYDCDIDFEQDYFNGRYDVICYLCDGNRVIPDVCQSSNCADDLKAFEDWVEDELEYRAERVREITYGY